MSVHIEASVSREISSSRSESVTEERTESSPLQETPSLSPTTASREGDYLSTSDGEWNPSDDVDSSDSISRRASRPTTREKNQVYIDDRPEQQRESSRPRLPPAPEVKSRRHHRREEGDPEGYRESHRSRRRHSRRRDPSSHSDSVGSHEHYAGQPRQAYSRGPPPQHPTQQWEFVQHQHPHPGYAASSVGSQGPMYNPFTGNPMPHPNSQLVHYQQPMQNPYYPHSPILSPYPPSHPSAASPLQPPPPPHSHQTQYFDPHRSPPHMPMMPYGYYPTYPMHPFPGMPPTAPPSGTSSSETSEITKLKEMMAAQEKAREAREEARVAKLEEERKKIEAERKAIDAENAKKAAEKETAEKLADAEAKAKAAAEADFSAKAKAAEAEHKKALEDMKKKAEVAQNAEKAAKEAEEAAKKEAAAAKPAEHPIKFKDAVGRTFSFPWNLCKTWKGMEALIKQAFLHVEVIGQHVQEGHYDLMGPNGEIILPQVWESTIEPDWTVTMHMWPMTEEKKEAPAIVVPKRTPTPGTQGSSGGGFFSLGRRRSKKKKSPPVINVPVAPSNANAVPPPPPPAPTRPGRSASAGPESRAPQVVKAKRSKSREPVPPLLAWSAASMGVRPRKAK